MPGYTQNPYSKTSKYKNFIGAVIRLCLAVIDIVKLFLVVLNLFRIYCKNLFLTLHLLFKLDKCVIGWPNFRYKNKSVNYHKFNFWLRVLARTNQNDLVDREFTFYYKN